MRVFPPEVWGESLITDRSNLGTFVPSSKARFARRCRPTLPRLLPEGGEPETSGSSDLSVPQHLALASCRHLQCQLHVGTLGDNFQLGQVEAREGV